VPHVVMMIRADGDAPAGVAVGEEAGTEAVEVRQGGEVIWAGSCAPQLAHARRGRDKPEGLTGDEFRALKRVRMM
jgi:hypothetical protein